MASPTSIRINEKILKKIDELAKRNKRSRNAQIEFLLEKILKMSA